MHPSNEKLHIQSSISSDFASMQLFVMDFSTLLEKIKETRLSTGGVLRSPSGDSGTYYIDGDWYLDYSHQTNRICLKAGSRTYRVKLSKRMFKSLLRECALICAISDFASMQLFASLMDV